MTQVDRSAPNGLNQRLATSGLRFTPQRQHVYSVLLEKLDHPTAEEVFIRSKQTMPDISIATVYNCLDALVTCGLIRQVNLDRTASRYCPNMQEHGHFYCEECKGVFDISHPIRPEELPLPRGFRPRQVELAIRGICPECSRQLDHSSRI